MYIIINMGSRRRSIFRTRARSAFSRSSGDRPATYAGASFRALGLLALATVSTFSAKDLSTFAISRSPDGRGDIFSLGSVENMERSNGFDRLDRRANKLPWLSPIGDKRIPSQARGRKAEKRQNEERSHKKKKKTWELCSTYREKKVFSRPEYIQSAV